MLSWYRKFSKTGISTISLVFCCCCYLQNWRYGTHYSCTTAKWQIHNLFTISAPNMCTNFSAKHIVATYFRQSIECNFHIENGWSVSLNRSVYKHQNRFTNKHTNINACTHERAYIKCAYIIFACDNISKWPH